MKAPGILHGVVVAFFITLFTAALTLFLGGSVFYLTLFEICLYGSTLIYLTILLKHSGTPVGRVVTISVWAVASMTSLLANIPPVEQVFIQAAIIWLTRSLYFHHSIVAAVLDLGLVLLGLAASAWAMFNTSSIAAAVWSFFLIQSMFCWIPDRNPLRSKNSLTPNAENASFNAAHRVALDAVRKIS
jgi:hypothetical protein